MAQPGSTLLDKTCAGDNVSLSTNFQISSWHKIIKAFASAKEYYLRFSIVKEAVRVRICRSYQNFYFKYTMELSHFRIIQPLQLVFVLNKYDVYLKINDILDVLPQ